MKRVKLEQAFIDALDMNEELFRARRYFLFRDAAYITKAIGGINNYHVCALIPVSNMAFDLPDDCIEVKKVINGNPFMLNEDDPQSYYQYKELDTYTSIPFNELEGTVSIPVDSQKVTVIYEAFMQDEQGTLETFECFLPAITNYILWKGLLKEKMNSALRGSQNYYMLRSEISEYERLYKQHITNARAELRYDEMEIRKILPDDMQDLSIMDLRDNLSVLNGQFSGTTTNGRIVIFANYPPPNPSEGTIWVDTNTMIQYIWYVDDDGSQWIEY